METTEPVAPELLALLERCRGDHLKWLNGDAGGYAPHADDDTVMGAVGGLGRGLAVAQGQERTASQFEEGTGTVEFIRGAVTGDCAWLVMIERGQVRFAGEGEPRRWDLRVTEVFRRVDGDWQRTHRHADPLVDHLSVADVLSLVGG